MKSQLLIFAMTAGLWVGCSNASAQEPSWRGPVIARGETREQIEATPILQRPYRPLHFYGNTVRRRHYRGQVMPAPRDVVGGTTAVLRRE
jgi:hypothetical protein